MILLLNTANRLIGMLIYYVFKLVFKSQESIHTAISTPSLVVGIPVVVLMAILFIEK